MVLLQEKKKMAAIEVLPGHPWSMSMTLGSLSWDSFPFRITRKVSELGLDSVGKPPDRPSLS
jgi:hypothetical protein